MTPPHVLVVDDEPALIAVLAPVLTAAGFHVSTEAGGARAIAAAEQLAPDVILLDLGLPDIDGKGVIGAIRARSDVPIIVLSARHQESEKVAALDQGADDYVDKPFNIGELMARIRVAARRRAAPAAPATIVQAGPLSIDLRRRQVTLDGDPVRLSSKEFRLLEMLARNAGLVVTHKRLLAAAWDENTTDTQYLRVYVGLLRQKIEEDPSSPQLLLTETGVGYRLVGTACEA